MLDYTTESDYDNPLHAEIAALDNIFVSHRSLTKVINGITDCISWSRVSREPKGALLKGHGGAGKTTVCQAILKRFPPKDVAINGAIVRTVPAFYSSVPSPSSIKTLASALLEQLGDSNPDSGTAAALTKRLIKLLFECRTRVILLDEFHHLLPKNSRSHASKMEEIRKWLINLVNRSKVMICLVGEPACQGLVSSEDQMFRRFSSIYQMRDISCGTKDKPGELGSFLHELTIEYAKALRLEVVPDFRSHEVSLAMFKATSGRPGFITKLLQTAIFINLGEGSSRQLTFRHLEDAFNLGITLSVAKSDKNPFASVGCTVPLIRLKENCLAGR